MCLKVVSGEFNCRFYVIVRGITVTKLYKVLWWCFVTIPEKENCINVPWPNWRFSVVAYFIIPQYDSFKFPHEGPIKFIQNVTKDIKSNLKKKERNFWNNFTLNGVGSEKSTRYREGGNGFHPPSYFHCLKVNWNKIWWCDSMSQILSKTIIILMTSSLMSCNYVILCFGFKVQLTNFWPTFYFKRD